MNNAFVLAGLRSDWLCWIGQPMLYDGGLCVNRTLEERKWSDMLYGRTPLCV